MDRVADADDQVGSAKGARDTRPQDPTGIDRFAPFWRLAGAERERTRSGTRFWPNSQVPLPSLLNCSIGSPERPVMDVAGRLAFIYHPDYLGGALFMALPSGRLLTYPRPRWRDVDVLDKDGNPTGEKRTELSFRRAHGRAKLWAGTFCENSVQATAADILRQTVTRIEAKPALAFMPIRMTTHDEIVCEVDQARAEEAKAILRREMLTLPEWAEGLPLQSDESSCGWYTKAKAALR
jgi:hypothetical protein